MTGTYTKIRTTLPSLRGADKRVAQYVIDNPQEIIYQSLNEVALKSGVSEPAVIRFSRKIGLRGFQDLKLHLSRDFVAPMRMIHEEIEVTDEIQSMVRKVFGSNIQTLQDTLEVLDVKEIERAVTAIKKARKILFIGVGTSGPNTNDAFHKFFRLGFNCNCYTDSHLQIMAASLLSPEDVVVAISHSGSTKDPIETLEVARECGAITIVITNNSISPIIKYADIVLNTASRETRFRSEAMASRIAQSVIIETLYTIVSMHNLDLATRLQERIDKYIVMKQL